MRFIFLAITISLGQWGCGGCPQVAESRALFLEKQERTEFTPEPQIVLHLPQTMVDGVLKETRRAMKSVSFRLPGLDSLERFLGRLTLTPRDVSLSIRRDQDAEMRVRMNVVYNRKSLFDMTIKARAPVQYDADSRRLSIRLRADLFESIEPVLSKNAKTSLTDMLLGELPKTARPLFPRRAVSRIAARSLRALTNGAYGLVRDKMLSPIDDLATFSISLPDVPIRGVTVRSGRHGWLVGIETTLRGKGVALSDTLLRSPRPKLLISTNFLTYLGNWAMAKGRIPGRYNKNGRASADGAFDAGVSWRRSKRPLKVMLWTHKPESSSICIYAKAAANPSVQLRNKKIKLTVNDARIERLNGPPLIEAAAAVMGVTNRVLNFSKEIAVDNEIRMGGTRLGITLVGMKLNADMLRFEFSPTSTKKTASEDGGRRI